MKEYPTKLEEVDFDQLNVGDFISDGFTSTTEMAKIIYIEKGPEKFLVAIIIADLKYPSYSVHKVMKLSKSEDGSFARITNIDEIEY